MFSTKAAIFCLINRLHPAKVGSSGLPGIAITSRLYDKACRAVDMAPPFMGDSATRIASLMPADTIALKKFVGKICAQVGNSEIKSSPLF